MSQSPKVVVLTGATHGLGRAMTEKLIALGHTVLGCGRTAKAIDDLKQTFGSPHHFAIVDVTREEGVRAWAEEILASHGAPDLLLNNAAIINRDAPLWELTAEEFDRVIDINIKGVANVLRHFLPALLARKSGVVVNFSSGWGRATAPKVAPYCATKFAIEGLTHALAQELPAGLTAVPFNPGIIDTAMLRSCFGGAAASYPNPREWAEKAVPFLLQIDPKDNGKTLTVPA